MNPEKGGLAPGLYMVAVPIGNARDITLRALDILRDAEVLAAEDTRSLRRLLEIHGVPTTTTTATACARVCLRRWPRAAASPTPPRRARR